MNLRIFIKSVIVLNLIGGFAPLLKAEDDASVAQLDPSLSKTPESPYSFLMKDIYLQAHSELQSIEMDLYEKKYSQAKFRAADLFDRIELKAKFVNVIPTIEVQEGIVTDQDIAYSFELLNSNKQDQIALALQGYQNGAFMNLLNLAKRTKLLYLKASLRQLLSERKRVYKRDVEMFVKEAIQVHNIAIKIKSPSMKYSYLVFDTEFANEVRDLDFNREILDFILDNAKYLKLDENVFEQLLKEDIAARRDRYALSTGIRKPAPPALPVARSPVNAEVAARCAPQIYRIFSSEMTFDIAQRISSDTNCDRFVSCSNNAYRAMSSEKAYEMCKSLIQ